MGGTTPTSRKMVYTSIHPPPCQTGLNTYAAYGSGPRMGPGPPISPRPPAGPAPG